MTLSTWTARRAAPAPACAYRTSSAARQPHRTPAAPHSTAQQCTARAEQAGCLRTPPHRDHETSRTALPPPPCRYDGHAVTTGITSTTPTVTTTTTATATNTATTSTVATVATRQLTAAPHRTRRTRRLLSMGSFGRRPSFARWRCRCYTHRCTPLPQVKLLHPPLHPLTRALLHLPLASGVAREGCKPHAHSAALQRLARPVEQQVAGPPPP